MSQESSGVPCLDFINTPVGGASRSAVEVRRFREVLYRILRGEAAGAGAAEADLRHLNDLLAKATERRGIVSTVRGYGWGWLGNPGRVLSELFPVAWSAAALLTSNDRHRLKLCDGCGILFLDQSRNRSRRWCDMRDCGNRLKQQRYRKKEKGAGKQENPA